MSRRGANRRMISACTAALVALAIGACGGGESDTVDPGSAGSESALTLEEAKAPIKKAPPELVSIRDEANEIFDEGADGYEGRIAELAGIPVVVNNWASWCAPCRDEIPFFQEQAIEHGEEVAFLGLISGDGPETAATFLKELPLPYPSYLDQGDLGFDVSRSLGIRGLPGTVFYASSGEVAYTKLGPYDSEEQLAADIDKYAG